MKYALTNGVILDGSKDMQPQRGKTVLTDGEIITAIVQDDADLNGYTVIDLQNRYLMPGLINMHVHLAGNGKPSAKPRDNAALVRKILSNGLTRAIAYRLVCSYAKLELLGGASGCPGDYLYRSGALRWDVESGMWGILRIQMRTAFYTLASCCRNVGQWWEKVWRKD